MIFSYDNRSRELLFMKKPLTPTEMAEVAQVRALHMIPDMSESNLYKALIFAISNQKTNYEQVLKFMHSLDGLELGYLKDDVLLHDMALNGPNRLSLRQNKYAESFRFVEKFGGIEKVIKAYLDDPREFRTALDDVKWIGLKTASLLYTSVGGDGELLCIDMHLAQQVRGFGIEIPETYYQAKRVISKKGQEYLSRHQLPNGMYLDIEKRIIDLVGNSRLAEEYPHYLLNSKGGVNGPYVHILLWWLSALNLRNGASQLRLFPNAKFQSPYTRPISRDDRSRSRFSEGAA